MTITSAMDFGALCGLASSGKSRAYWLGASGGPGKWSWCTGESTEYARSVTVQGFSMDVCAPTYFSNLGNCLAFYSGFDYPIYTPPVRSDVKGYICEWDSMSDYVLGSLGILGSGNKSVIKTLKGLLMLKGTLAKGSTIDTDNDGLTDYNELNTKLLKLVYGVNTTKTTVRMADVVLALKNNNSSKNLISTSLSNKVSSAAAKTGNSGNSIMNEELVYTGSSPVSEDSDYDYYLDSEEERISGISKKHWDKTKIDDAIICDTNSPKGMLPDKSSYNTTNGSVFEVACDGGSAKTNAIDFGRSTDWHYNHEGYTSVFSLNPRQYSDYIFDVIWVENIADVDFKVTYVEEHWFSKDETITVSPIAEPELTATGVRYRYSLEPGVQYTISVNCNNDAAGYEVIVQQNNWVYAPNGAIVEAGAEISSGWGTYKEDHTMIYLKDVAVKNAIQGYYYHRYGYTVSIGDFQNLTESQKRDSCRDIAQKFIESYKLSQNSEIFSGLGDFSTVGGAFFTTCDLVGIKALPLIGLPTGLSATALTYVGLVALVDGKLVKLENDRYEKALADSIYDGEYNVVMDIMYKSNHSMTDNYSYNKVLWHAWTNKGYVYKYAANGDINTKYKVKSIQALDYYVPVRNGNSWSFTKSDI